MGKPRDMSQRVTLARVDDVKRRTRVEAARKAIYEQNLGVDSAAVERLLKDDSLVPAAVSSTSFIMRPMLMLYYFRMHSLINYHHSTSICLRC